MPSLDIFLPEDRRQALARGDFLPASSRGAVLFADIFGFTKLTALLSSELGPQRGAEELTRQLDPIYSRLFDAIHDYRGSVIGISGDGLTCWFDGDEGGRAANCALQMQTIMAENGSINLTGGAATDIGIKIALSVGHVRRFLVGDPRIQLIEALAGRELDRVYSAQERLDKGQVAVGRAVWEKIRDRVQVGAWIQSADGEPFAIVRGEPDLASRDPWPDIPPLAADVARQWIFASVYERIRAEELEYLTELRQVAPMFLKFNGIDYDHDEQAGEKLDAFIRRVQDILHRYEGYLCQLTIGDKGSNLFIVFGAPIAHKDNVDRALAAALKLKTEIESLGFIQSVEVGVTHGKVWAGAHGGGRARTYSAIGAEVNIANRLMARAQPGQILVSPHVVDVAQNYAFERLDPIQLKGIEKPMAPSLLLGRSRAQGDSPASSFLLGRERERELLAEKLEGLLRPDGLAPPGVVVIEGEAGIGKSRLVSGFVAQAKGAGVAALVSEADPVEKSTQYFAMRPILETVFGLAETDDGESAREKISRAVSADPFLAERAPLLGEVLPLRWPETDFTRQITGEARANTLRGVLLAVLRNFIRPEGGRLPAALVLDDAQWLDAATWTLLNALPRELPDLLILVSLRPLPREEMGEQNEQEYQRLRASPRTRVIRLSSLSGEEITAIVAQRLGVDNIPRPLIEFIRARAQGNPFFSEEIALALRDTGVLRVGENREALIGIALEELSRLDFPDTVQGVVTSRIDRLAPSHQLTLKVASVIGRAFLLSALVNVHPARVSGPTLEQYLAALTQLGITELESLTPELAYMFKHVITQEVVYNLLTFAQRKQLHCAIAEWYETNYRADLSPYYSRLAHHWTRGENREKAIYYLDKAAEQSLELFSNENVIRFIAAAMELDQRTPAKDALRNLQRARWERMLGMANFRLGRLPEAQAHLARTLELLGRPLPDSPSKLSRALLAELFKQLSHRFFPRQLQRRQSESQRAVEEELARVDIESVYYYSQNNALLAWGMLRRLNLAERLGMPELMAQGYSNLQLITGLVKLTRANRAYDRLTHGAIEKTDNASLRIYALLREAVVYFLRCDWPAAARNFETGLQLAEQIGDARQWSELNGAYATALYLQGQFEAADARWREHLLRYSSRVDEPQPQAWSLYGQGHALLMRGRVDEALSLLQASLTVPMKNADDKILNTSRFGALSLAWFRKGDYDKTLASILDHQRAAPPTPAFSSTIAEYDSVFDAILGLWDCVRQGRYRPSAEQRAQLEAAFHHIPRAARTLKVSPVNAAKVYLYQGLCHNLAGKPSRAALAWKKSVELAELHSQPYELGRAHYEIGRSLPPQDPARNQRLMRAVKLFEELQTPYELDLARAALA
ncbi:MAG: adenylate/guanylate cyclase domain-containing protein [Chloroflexota bacterium]